MDKRGTANSDTYRLFFKSTADDWRFRLTTTTTGSNTNVDTTGLTWAADEWQFLVATYDGSNMRIFWNGSEQNIASKTGNITTNDVPLFIGYSQGSIANHHFEGIIDEVRISSIVRSPDWIQTCYNNQNNPSGFYSLGSEQWYADGAIKVQRGSTDISLATSATATAPTDFETVSSLSRAFVRIVSAQGTGTGEPPAGATNIPPDELAVTAEFTDTSTITFTRTTSNRGCRVYWEIWEYRGQPGGDNEFIVRGQGASDELTITDTYVDMSVSGVSDINDCVVFLTGVQSSSSSVGNYWANTFHAYLFDLTTVRIERAATGVSVWGSYAVVEFTGSNWTVQTGTHTFTAAGVREDKTITALAATDKAFLISQHMTDQNGLDDYGYRAWIINTSTASFQLRLGADVPANHIVRYWVVESSATDFLVRRGGFTVPDSADDNAQTYNQTITEVADLDRTGLIFSHDTNGGGTAFPRACRIARLTSLTNLEVYCSRGNQPSDCRYETIEFPGGIFLYRKQITIDYTQVSSSCSSDLTDFPVLVSISNDTDLRDHVNNPSGYDIVFRDPDGTTLDHEIEKWDSASGTLAAWVRIPTLKYDEDTVFFIYYGNSSISSSTENAAGVWDSDYKMVQHMNDATLSTILDSTSNDNDGTKGSANNPDEVSGKIGGAQDFDSNSEYISLSDTDTWTWTPVSQDRTLSFWYYPTALPTVNGNPFQFLVTSVAPGNRYEVVYLRRSAAPTSALAFLITDNSWSYIGYFYFEGTPTLSTWYHITFVASSSGNNKFYVNGTELSVIEGSWDDNTEINPSTTGIKDTSGASTGTGYLDEMRFSHIARPACWIETEYNNQNDPSSFYSIGSEEENAATAVRLISFNAVSQGALILVSWETAQEVNNLGFNLYRRTGLYGSYINLNSSIIKGLISSVAGRKYLYADMNVTQGVTYYYLLEDVDLKGKRTRHGPVCVDWGAEYVPNDYDNYEKPIEYDSDAVINEGMPETGIPVETPDMSGSVNGMELAYFKASQQEEGVSLEWQTSYEVDILGFHVYREVDFQFFRITPNLLPGSVFKVGAGNKLPAGQTYVFWDSLSNKTGRELFWLECTDLSGGRAYFGPVTPETDKELLSEPLKSRFNTIAKNQLSKTQEYWKIRKLRKQLGARPVQGSGERPSFRNIIPEKRFEPRLPPAERQWSLSGQAAVKIFIKEEGWYRIGESELVEAGLDPGVDPRYLQLYTEGQEQAMIVSGSLDGYFGSEDAVEFYGTGIDTPYSDARVYWLIDGSQPGKRIQVARGRGYREAASSFPYTEELKERTFFFAALKNGEEDSFFGPTIWTEETASQLLTVTNIDPSPPEDALLEVVLQGGTDLSHYVKILLNDEEVGEVFFDGQEQGIVEINIPHDMLLEGDNIITFEAQGGEEDVSFVDYVRLTYWHTYTADENALRFTASGGELLFVEGFSSTAIRVMDITNPAQVFEVRGRVSSRGTDYGISIEVPGSGQRTLLAFTEGYVGEPVGLKANLTSTWQDRARGADVVVIAHEDFFESLSPLIELREQQGWSVVLVDVEDLYDEFNYGAKSPWALRDFLTRAYSNWAPPPRFVLLVGDASFDPRNYLGLGDYDLVPTKLVETGFIKSASDDWFVDFENDGLPKMAIGRLPVYSIAEAEIVINKIIAYEGTTGSMNEVLFVADEIDFFDFEGASDALVDLLPPDIIVTEIFRGQSPTARDDLLDTLNRGQKLVNYLGHGSAETWRGNLFGSTDASALTNSPNLSFFVNMTCLNGYFHDVQMATLAEALLKAAQGGAVAVWSSSSLTDPSAQVALNRGLIQLLFNGQSLTLGEATMLAKEYVSDQDIRKSWILFGDPLTKLR